jgi:hypothetical protein
MPAAGRLWGPKAGLLPRRTLSVDGPDLDDPFLGFEIDAIERHGYRDTYPMLTSEQRAYVLDRYDRETAEWIAADEEKADRGDPTALLARRIRRQEAAER